MKMASFQLRRWGFVHIGVFAIILAISWTPAADAALELRVSSWTSAGVLVDSDTDSDPGMSLGYFGGVTGFSVIIASNIATTGLGETKHSETINVTYDGAASGADVLVVEFAGSPYVNPAFPSFAQVDANASPSTSGLSAGFVEMISGVFSGAPAVPLAGPPTPIAPPAGLLGNVTLTGTMGAASSVLVPNPGFGAVFSIPTTFTFYQRFTFGDLGSAETGSISSGTTVRGRSDIETVPEPAALCMWAFGAMGLIALRMRRVKVAV